MDSKNVEALDFFLFAGEKSADLLGADLIDHLLQLNPNLRIAAVAGPQMRAYPISCVMQMEQFEIMGFIDVVRHLPRLLRQFGEIKRTILNLQPAQVIFIDYPGFNLPLARKLRRAGFQKRLIQYVCPTIWAWKKNRLKTMVENLDAVLTLFPFETRCFSGTSLPAHFVGHPLVKKIPAPQKREKEWLGLFPGSRRHEIERNLPLQLKAAAETGLPIGISVASPSLRPLIETLSAPYSNVTFFENSYELMKLSAFAIAKSGTVNLELALFEVPTVVTYGINSLDLFIARKIFKIDLAHYCLVNILAEKEIFPELYGPRFTEAALRAALKGIRQKKEAVTSECRLLRDQLSQSDAGAEAARLLIQPSL